MISPELIERLKGLAQCQEGHKYNVITKSSSPAKSWWTTGERIWYNQSRNSLIKELEDILSSIQKEINEAEMYQKDISSLPRDIGAASDGLFNVCMSYVGDDQDIVAEINKKIKEFRDISSFINRNYSQKAVLTKRMSGEIKSEAVPIQSNKSSSSQSSSGSARGLTPQNLMVRNTPSPVPNLIPQSSPNLGAEKPGMFKQPNPNPYANMPFIGSSPNNFPFSRHILTSSDKYTQEDIKNFNEFLAKTDKYDEKN